MPSKKKKKSLKKKISHKISSSSNLPTALVAGAAGFIGSHLCEALLHQNCRVYGIDNWTTGKKENLKHLLKNDSFVFIEHDLNKSFESPVPQVDYIFHLAGVEAYVNGHDVSLETLLVNSLGTRELLEVSKTKNAKYLLASTIDIFSGFLSGSDLSHYFGTKHKQEEAYSHHEAKRFSEALTFEYVNSHNIDARIVRLGNVYGPRMDLSAGNDLAKLFESAQKGDSLKIFDQGIKQLYPSYISDVVYGLTKAMFSQSSKGHIYTLVNPVKTTTLNIAYKLKELIKDKDLKIEFVSGEKEDSVVTLSEEILNSQKELGWFPKIEIEEGIKQTMSWLNTGDIKVKALNEEPSSSPEPDYTAENLGLNQALPPKPEKTISPPKNLSKKKGTLKLKSPLKKLSLPKPKISLKGLFKKKPIKLSLKPNPKPSSKRTKTIALIVSLVAVYLIGPILLMGTFAYTGAKSLQKASSLTNLSQLEELTKLTTKAEKNFLLSRKFLRQSQFTAKIIGAKSLANNLDRLLFIATKLSRGALNLTKAGESGTLLSQIVFQNYDGNISEALRRIQISLNEAYDELSFVESDLQSGKQLDLDLSTSLNKKIQTLTSDLPLMRKKINQVRSILPLVPSLIAQDSKKTYLLLFQNSAEIRPTGGFIGSYGLLTFDKGRLLDFSVEDIYSADGQLKGFVEPPEPIKKFLGQNTWFFRDSNWNPDFTISAQRAEWFLNKTTNRNVDGVIAVNLPAVKELLKATGPIQLADYNEEVNSENLFDRAEYRSEIDFFPGSTQKKDFLGSLAREIFDKAQNAQAGDLLKFAEAIETSLTQKQILIYLHDQDSQKILLDQNWAGALYKPNLTTLDNRPVTVDYAYLVEANLGINKANFFLTRNIKQQLTLLKNKEILAVTSINYNNQSPADAWPGGIYRSYLRSYIPKDSKIISITTGGEKLDLDKDIDQEVVEDKLVLGFSVTVPVKNSLDVEITYRLPKELKLRDNVGRLSIVIPKQPGIVNDTLEVIVNHPTYLTVAAANPQALVSPQVVTFKSDFLTDRVFNIDFIEK